MAIGAAWAEGSWVDAGWASGAWEAESDTTAPELVSASISGDVLSLNCNEDMQVGGGGSGGVALTASGGALTPTFDAVSGSTVTYTLSREPASSETITVDYTQPGDGLEDLAENDLESFSDESVSLAGLEGTLQTAFISDPVPDTAVFRAGTAYTNDGKIYVCTWPGDVTYVRGIAHRNDGAMVIATGVNVDFTLGAWGLTYRGEVAATNQSPEVHHHGIPRLNNGKVCMSDIS